MAVSFPNNPIVNDEFTSSSRTWIWDGNVWLLKATLELNIPALSDVSLTNLANGEALLYNSVTQKWENGEVDIQGAVDEANEYTDQAVLDLTGYIDGFLEPSTGTIVEYIDQQDAATLTAASEYTNSAIDDLIGMAPSTLDTLAELAAAFNNDPNFLESIDALPAQAGNDGYYLTTDGTIASWSPLETSSTTVSELPPTGSEEGDTWFRSSTGQYFVYYDSFWIEIGAGSSPDLSEYYTSEETELAILSATVNKKTEFNEAISSNVNLEAGHRYFIDTSAERSLFLPAAPSLGDEIQIFDAVGLGATNNVFISNNSEKINGVLDSAIIDINGFATVFVYTGSSYGWRMI